MRDGEREYAHRIPSSSDDLTLAKSTSEANGRKTTSRNITGAFTLHIISSLSLSNYNGPTRIWRTFIPITPIPIPHLPLPNLREVEHTDTQPDIVQHAVCVLLVELVDNCLLGWEAEVRGEDGDCVLCESDDVRVLRRGEGALP